MLPLAGIKRSKTFENIGHISARRPDITKNAGAKNNVAKSKMVDLKGSDAVHQQLHTLAVLYLDRDAGQMTFKT